MVKIFLAFVRKEMYHILRDQRTLAILFGMPIALVLIFGYTVTNEFKDASMVVIDQARDELSTDLVTHLTASGHFQLADQVPTLRDLEATFQANRAKLGIVIPPDFASAFQRKGTVTVQLIADATEPNYATTLVNYATQMIRSYQQRENQMSIPPYTIGVETRMFYNPQLEGAYNFVPGTVAFILMLICAMMTSLTIAKEKETGTMDLLLVSPLPPILIILGKVTPYAVLSFIDAIIILILGYVLFDVPVRGSLALLLTLCLLYLMVALALGVLISTRAPDQQTAMMTSLFTLLMPTILLSGFIFPIASMPVLLQWISQIIPANYFIQIEKSIMLKAAGWEAVAFPSVVLLTMLVVLLLAAWRNFKVVRT
ncbi:MAG: ABC transporter permease [Bacteroidota bacterium]